MSIGEFQNRLDRHTFAEQYGELRTVQVLMVGQGRKDLVLQYGRSGNSNSLLEVRCIDVDSLELDMNELSEWPELFVHEVEDWPSSLRRYRFGDDSHNKLRLRCSRIVLIDASGGVATLD
jgi:hypothetical protein